MNNLTAIMRYMQNLDALAEAVSEEMKRQKLNTYEVADRATKKGYKIVHGTVWNVINQNVKEVKDKTVVAISHGLGVPEKILFSALRGTDLSKEIENERFNRIAQGFARLATRDKEKIEPFLTAIEQTIALALPAGRASVAADEGEEITLKTSAPRNKGGKSGHLGGQFLKLVEGTSGSLDEQPEAEAEDDEDES